MQSLLHSEFARALAAEKVRNAEKARTALTGSASRHANRRGFPRLCALRKERGVAWLGDYHGEEGQR
jgi:hypothetical protein